MSNKRTVANAEFCITCKPSDLAINILRLQDKGFEIIAVKNLMFPETHYDVFYRRLKKENK